MLWYMLMSEELRIWEQRIGAWVARCQGCRREAWQLTFRIWRTKGTGMSPPTPYGLPYGECHQGPLQRVWRRHERRPPRSVGTGHRARLHQRELPAGLRDAPVRDDRLPGGALSEAGAHLKPPPRGALGPSTKSLRFNDLPAASNRRDASETISRTRHSAAQHQGFIYDFALF